MRIGIDIRNIGKKRTGDEVVFLNLVRELARVDDENQYFLLLDKRTESEYRDISKRLGIVGKKNIRLVPLPAKNKFDWNLWRVSNFIRKNPIDVYHTQYIVPFFIPKTTKIVTHIHDVSFKVYPELIAKKDRFFLNLLLPWSLRRAEKIITPSDFTRREVEKYYQVPSEKLCVIWNAVASEFFEKEKNESEREVIRAKYHLPASFALYVGTLQPRKNIPFLIEAFSCFRVHEHDMDLVLVGNRSGHHFDFGIDKAISRFHVKKFVHFPGFIEEADISTVMGMARIFVFPSLYEGFGIPLIEAMSQSVPVVASDIPSLHEAGGDAVLYANATNTNQFSEAMHSLSSNEGLRGELRKKGLVRSKLFSWEHSARELLAVYREICFHGEIVRCRTK